MASIFFATKAIQPRYKENIMKKAYLENYQSILYFQDIASITPQEYLKKAKKAIFSRVKPLKALTQGDWGAWELALRMSYLDIDDQDEEESIEKNYTVGINWYATDNLRIMANYIHATLSKAEDEDIMQLRMQFDF